MKTFTPNQSVSWVQPVADPRPEGVNDPHATVPIRRVRMHGRVIDYTNTTVSVRVSETGECLTLPIQMVDG